MNASDAVARASAAHALAVFIFAAHGQVSAAAGAYAECDAAEAAALEAAVVLGQATAVQISGAVAILAAEVAEI